MQPYATVEPDLEQLGQVLNGTGLTLWDYITAAAIVVLSLVAGRVARMVVKRVIRRSPADTFLGDLIGRLVNYLVVAFGLVYGLETLGIAIGPILGALGIVGIALAFAFQDILENFVAGIILQLQRPFTGGDEIVTGDHQGTIVSVDARTITMRTPDGEVVHIPSAEVVKNPILNYSQRGPLRTTVEVGVAYGTNLDTATGVALEATRRASGVENNPEPRVFVESFDASSISLAVKFWHTPTIASRWETRDQVMRSIDQAFVDNDISIPFPQRVLHLDVDTDKPAELPIA